MDTKVCVNANVLQRGSNSAYVFQGIAHVILVLVIMSNYAVGSDVNGDDSTRCIDQHASDGTVSLAAAVDLALCNNPQIRASWAVIREQQAVVGEARSQYWPTLGVTVGELEDRTSYPGSAAPGSERSGDTVYAALDWRLFDFGGRGANRRAAEAQLAAAVASKDASIQKILGAIAQTYFEAVGTRGLARDRLEAEAIAEETLASAKRRASIGEAGQGDVLQSSTALAKATLARNQADAAYIKANALLSYLTGLPADRTIDLPEELDAPATAEEDAVKTWLSAVEQHHPSIVAARAALDAAREHVSAIRSAGLPTLDLVANYYQNGFPNQGLNDLNTRVLTVGLSVNIPVFDGWLTRRRIEEAQAVFKIREAELADTERSALMAVVNAHADAMATLRNLRASEDLLRAAQQSFESSQRRYRNGVGNILELLTTQASRGGAQEQRVRMCRGLACCVAATAGCRRTPGPCGRTAMIYPNPGITNVMIVPT